MDMDMRILTKQSISLYGHALYQLLLGISRTKLEMVSPASSLYDRRSISPTTATNTFAATARDDPASLIGMGKTTMAASCLVERVYTLGARGVSGKTSCQIGIWEAREGCGLL